MCGLKPKWRNWQTHGTQNPAVLSTMGVRPPPSAPAKSDSDQRVFASTQFSKHSGVGVGTAIGLGIGTAVGAALQNIAMGMALGLAFGVAIGLAIGAGVREKGNGKSKRNFDTKSTWFIH